VRWQSWGTAAEPYQAPQLIDTAANRATFPAELLTHAVRPEAIANVIAFLAGDLAAPVSGAIVPVCGA
jgi:NAD(P)-dependent dehydrogenase (short-subunit alcohol dehydrogenase family)